MAWAHKPGSCAAFSQLCLLPSRPTIRTQDNRVCVLAIPKAELGEHWSCLFRGDSYGARCMQPPYTLSGAKHALSWLGCGLGALRKHAAAIQPAVCGWRWWLAVQGTVGAPSLPQAMPRGRTGCLRPAPALCARQHQTLFIRCTVLFPSSTRCRPLTVVLQKPRMM